MYRIAGEYAEEILDISECFRRFNTGATRFFPYLAANDFDYVIRKSDLLPALEAAGFDVSRLDYADPRYHMMVVKLDVNGAYHDLIAVDDKEYEVWRLATDAFADAVWLSFPFHDLVLDDKNVRVKIFEAMKEGYRKTLK